MTVSSAIRPFRMDSRGTKTKSLIHMFRILKVELTHESGIVKILHINMLKHVRVFAAAHEDIFVQQDHLVRHA